MKGYVFVGTLQFAVRFNKRGQDPPTYEVLTTHDVDGPLLEQSIARGALDMLVHGNGGGVH